MRSSRLAHVQHTGVARSEQVWLLTLGSSHLRSFGATGRGVDQQTWPLVARCDSRMYALGHNSEAVGIPKDKGAEVVPRLALAAHGAMLLHAERKAGKIPHAGVAQSEQAWSVMLGSAPSRGCIATGKVQDQHA